MVVWTPRGNLESNLKLRTGTQTEDLSLCRLLGGGLPDNYDKQVWQAGAQAAVAVALRRAGNLWIGSVISTSHSGAVIINLVCLQNEY